MKKVWEATLKIFMEIGNTHLTKPSQWQACRDIALSLKEYFHAEGDGLIGDDLDSPAFKVNICVIFNPFTKCAHRVLNAHSFGVIAISLCSASGCSARPCTTTFGNYSAISNTPMYFLWQTFLFEVNLRSQPTSSLVLKCCSNLVAQQMTAVDLPTNQQQFGELSLTIGYLKTSSVIEVKVLEARNIPVDKICKFFTRKQSRFIVARLCSTVTGFMPSVELQLLPSILFEDNPKELYRTKKYKQQTQNPQFRETFQM